MKADLHPREEERLAALQSLDLLDSASEQDFDELVELASAICNTPMALICLVDRKRQWFKARVGIAAAQSSRLESVCAHAILSSDPLVIEDTEQDLRTHDNPLWQSDTNMRFYAGVPLVMTDDLPIGTLCVLDTIPREIDSAQMRALQILSRQVMARIKLRSALLQESALKAQIQEQLNELHSANFRLTDADESKNLFLAMLSHELRNPLSALHNGLQLLRESERETDESALDMLQRQCWQLQHLLDDLLDIARISQGKISLMRECVDVAGVLENVFDSVTSDAIAKHQTLILNNLPESTYISADMARVQQIVANLLSNAVRYTQANGCITVSAAVVEQHVIIEVIDTGKGIEPDDQERIFDLFVQVTDQHQPSSTGLGLGLALVAELLRLHDGSIEVESEGLGKGTTFTLLLPLIKVPDSIEATEKPADAEPVVPNVSVATPVRETRGTTLDILVTDDNVDSNRAMGKLLERRGHQVRLCYSGQDALAQVELQQPDALLLDIGLPDISGLDVARQVRQKYTGVNTPLLIATTGYGQASDRQRSLDAGFDYHLVKPVNLSELHELLAAHSAGADNV